MRRTLIALLVLACGAAGAVAGDYADHEVIGFSPDGKTFAFEEFGIEDGSGFPYSNIFIINTDTDEWVPETPIRLRPEDETKQLADVRKETRSQAQPLLDQYGVSMPGSHVATSPATGTEEDPDEFVFQPRGTVPPSGVEMTLKIVESTMVSLNCPTESGPYKGFQLTLASSYGTVHTLQMDTRIPGSRNCPKGYGISDVITLYPEGGGAPVIAILTSVYSLGFEGANRRFLAVATRFKE